MIETLISIAQEAGNKILEIYQNDFEIYEKEDKSPLTEADLAANEIIVSRLKKSFPNIPILSEESSKISYADRKSWEKFFLVDPIDGTKEFIKKNGEFTVNIALIEKGIPVAGVVYIPVADKFYFARKGEGAFLRDNQGDQRLPIFPFKHGSLRVVASKSHLNEETKNFVETLNHYGDVEFIQVGSSIKLCKVAEGSADIYPRVAPTSEWDTGAAHAIVLESGGEVIQFENHEPVVYNKENILNPFFIVKRKEIKL